MQLAVETVTGVENMRRDLALVDRLRQENAPWLWRLYTWQPWAVSLGKHQRIDVIDASAATKHGIDIVHRPTGGRAVLHANELTYCVVATGSPQSIYASVHQLIHRALVNILGENGNVLEFDTVGTDLRSHYASGSDMGQACFATSARSEIMVGGRKVVGSAQCVQNDVVLQHGSILCGPEHLLLSELVSIPDERRAAFRQALQQSSISLQELSPTPVTPTIVAEAIADVVATELSVQKA